MHDIAYSSEKFVGVTKGGKVVTGDSESLCNGAVYLLIRLMAFITKDSEMMNKVLWETESETSQGHSVPYAIKLLDAIMLLLFKPGYTTRL
jgi:hypothetical protein